MNLTCNLSDLTIPGKSNDRGAMLGWGTHIKELLVDLLNQDLHACKDGGGCDSRAHQPAAEHSDLLDGAGFEADVCDALHPLGGALGKEDVHQGLVGVKGC